MKLFCQKITKPHFASTENPRKKDKYKMLVKLTPSISSTFSVRLFHTKFWRQKTKVLFSSYIFGKKALLYKKHVRKMLVKLTPDLKLHILHIKDEVERVEANNRG